MRQQVLVFTDMDGTLLDHDTYSFEAAQPALTRCRQLKIPVIPVTSKTRAEVIPLMTALGLDGPFIVENGAGVYVPAGYFKHQPTGTYAVDNFWCYSQVPPRSKWLDLLDALASEFPGDFTHFDKMGVAGIQTATNLSLEAAMLAQQRDFGEPVQWLGETARQEQFIAACQAQGARILKGGRFLHVAGPIDKGVAVNWLCDVFRGAGWSSLQTIGLGDSHNDVAMLETVDFPVFVRGVNSDNLTLKRSMENVCCTEQRGPAGWQVAVTALLDSLEVVTP
jgi:mannosyl-3-phosphoglycerate phosphatase